MNSILKLLTSIPVILIFLYFIPFLGIVLLILRYFVVSSKEKKNTSFLLILISILIFVPKIISTILNIINIDINSIPYLKEVISSEIYNVNFMKYSKLLLNLGIIFLVLGFILKNVFNKLEHSIKSYIFKQEQKDYEISKKNDLIMKEKREKAKNTHVVYCPNCGADNILTEQVGTCKYCRRKIKS